MDAETFRVTSNRRPGFDPSRRTGMTPPLKVEDVLLNSEKKKKKLAHLKSLRKVKHMNMRDIRVAVLYVNV